MAGTSHPGLAPGALFMLDQAADYIGKTPHTLIPYDQWDHGLLGGSPKVHDAFIGSFLATGGTPTTSGGSGATKSIATHPGIEEARRTSFSIDWHETVHLLPRTLINFGNIITLEQDEYEIFNGYRDTAITLTVITNNVAPGITLPNIAVTDVAQKQCSYLDPTSTGNDGGTGLGTLVKLKVNAEADGLPSFNGTVDFDFNTGNSVSLLLAGSRIVLLPMVYEAPMKETLAWLTEIIEGLNGQEQRIALRKQPRQIFEVVYRLDANERQRMQAILFDWMDNTFGFPLWHERVFTTAAVSIGATAYLVRNADDCDFRVGGLAVIIGDNATYDVINITAVTATQITAADPSQNAYAAGTAIMPLRTAIIRRAVPGARFLNKLEDFKITFEVTDNDTGALTGSTTPGFWSIYNSRVLFDDCNVVEGDTMREEFRRKVYRIDNETGVITQSSSWDRNKRSQEKGFVLRDRADILLFRRLLTSLRGKQKAFYIPTFAEDLTPVATLVTGTDTMDVAAHEYVRFVQSRFPMNLFKIEFTDGTSLIREVQSAVEVSSTVERLTLDTTWPSNRTVDEVVRIQFYELVRLDTDEVDLNYDRIGLARCTVPLLRVFDDN